MPTIDIPDKICPHCGGIRWIVYSEKAPTKDNPDKRRTKYTCWIKQLKRLSEARKRRYAALSEDEKRKIQKERYKTHGPKQLEIQKKKRKEYRLLNPILEKPKKSEEQKRLDHNLHIKNWYHLNKDKPEFIKKIKEKSKKRETSLTTVCIYRLFKKRLGIPKNDVTLDMLHKYKTYLLALRQLKQLENEEKNN